VGTRTFQRLRNVKQLALVPLVFPGADYSRFSHSIGVCHVTGLLLEQLQKSKPISQDEWWLYRVAGLLHDVGHYPYSHPTELAIQNHYVRDLTPYFMHEAISATLMTADPELVSVLRRFGIDPKAVAAVIQHESPSPLANLVTSDLDADRIDYLLRTAHHTGLPYGSVDITYLVAHMKTDKQGRVCLDPRALRTADHFLLCRYFDYQQVTYHKTVVALENVLQDVVSAVLSEGILDCSRAAIEAKIAEGKWHAFDDAVLVGAMRKAHDTTPDAVVKLKTQSVLNRIPPILVAQREYIGKNNKATRRDFFDKVKLVKTVPARLAERFGIDPRLCWVWGKPRTLTKVGATVPLEDAEEGIEGSQEVVRVHKSATNESEPIMTVDRSLMHLLSEHATYSVRLYVLAPGLDQARRNEIRAFVREIAPINWD